MAKLVILGTASFVPDETHDNAHLVVHGPVGSVLIDSGINPLVSLKRANLPFASLQAIIVTHFHPDHVSGLPNFLMGLWLMGRKTNLTLYGFRVTLDKVQALMSLFEWRDWPGFYPVAFEPVRPAENALIIETPDFRIHASPTHHLVPSLALKFTSPVSGRSIVYSSDTSPCDALERLARGADVLIHEIAGAASGHSSPAMAGAIARQAGAGHLVLIHYHTTDSPDDLIAEARSTFGGQITLAQDMDVFEF
jgi:ribonuclease Z